VSAGSVSQSPDYDVGEAFRDSDGSAIDSSCKAVRINLAHRQIGRKELPHASRIGRLTNVDHALLFCSCPPVQARPQIQS
jgi:hypothetical protein